MLYVFGAIWDYDSRKLFNYLDKLDKEYGDRIRLGFVGLDFAPDVFWDHEVYEIPTVMVFEDGKELKRKEKAESTDDVDKIARYLLGIFDYMLAENYIDKTCIFR